MVHILAWLLAAWAALAAAEGPVQVPLSDIQDGSSEQEKWWNPILILMDKKTTTTTGLFDCYTDLADWRSVWSDDRQRWCCENVGSGCPDYDPPTTTTTAPYDCKDSHPTSWSVSRRRYCCVSNGRGCLSEAELAAEGRREEEELREQEEANRRRQERKRPKPVPYRVPGAFDCFPGPVGSDPPWGEEHLRFCCAHEGVGCSTSTTTPAPTTTPVPTTPATLPVTSTTLTSTTLSTTEPPTTTATTPATTGLPTKNLEFQVERERYDCVAAYSSAVSSGFVADEALSSWCCDKHGVFCPGDKAAKSSAEPYDCQAGLLKFQQGFPVPAEQQTWCCTNAGVFCATTMAPGAEVTTEPPFDCNWAFDQWTTYGVPQVPEATQQWCCSTTGKFCPDPRVKDSADVANHFDCQAALDTWRQTQESVPLDAQTYCCNTMGVFCSSAPAAPPALPYDCVDFRERMDAGEQVRQDIMTWCCATSGIFCSIAPSVQGVPGQAAVLGVTAPSSEELGQGYPLQQQKFQVANLRMQQPQHGTAGIFVLCAIAALSVGALVGAARYGRRAGTATGAYENLEERVQPPSLE